MAVAFFWGLPERPENYIRIRRIHIYVPASSKWPFDHPNGGHLYNPWKGHFNHPKGHEWKNLVLGSIFGLFFVLPWPTRTFDWDNITTRWIKSWPCYPRSWKGHDSPSKGSREITIQKRSQRIARYSFLCFILISPAIYDNHSFRKILCCIWRRSKSWKKNQS